MKTKNRFGRIAAGILSMITFFTSVYSPAAVLAAESGKGNDSGYSEDYPEISSVRDKLADDEIVKAEDITIYSDENFDISKDMRGISYSSAKVKVRFYQAKDSGGSAFSASRPGTYTAVYHAEPVSGNHSYRFNRRIIVQERKLSASVSSSAPDVTSGSETTGDKAASEEEDEAHQSGSEGKEPVSESSDAADEKTEDQTEVSENRESENGSEVKSDDTDISEEEENAEAEDTDETASEDSLTEEISETEETEGKEGEAASGLTEPEWISEAERQKAVRAFTGRKRLLSASSSAPDMPESFTVISKYNIEYSDLGYGTWHTKPVEIVDSEGNNLTLLCMEPTFPGYEAGETELTIAKVTDPTIIKIFYYGAFGGGTNYAKQINGDANADILITHIAASKTFFETATGRINSHGDKWDFGCNKKFLNDVDKYLDKIASLPVPENVTCFMTTGHKADGGLCQCYCTIIEHGKARVRKVSSDPDLTDGDETYSLKGAKYGIYTDPECKSKAATLETDETGKTEYVILYPGTYYVKEIEAPENFQLSTEVFTASVPAGGSVTVKAADEPVPYGEYKIIKRSADSSLTEGNSSYDLEGAVYGVYSSRSCTEEEKVSEITTIKDGDSLKVRLAPGTYYVKEIKAPKGFYLDSDVYELVVKAKETSVLEMKDVPLGPSVRTEAVDQETGDHVVRSDGSVTITDTVSYTMLAPGKSYTLEGSLMDKGTGKPVTDASGKEVTASKEFKVSDSGNGTVLMDFVFMPASSFAGTDAVVFETVRDQKGKEIASHKDVNDEKQTVHAPAVETNAEDGLTEDHTGTVSEKSIVRDIVTCRNLVIGKEYTVTGTLMDKATGKSITDKSGNPVSAEKTFKAEKKDGEITLEFSVDSSLLEGKTVVAFEDLYHGKVKVAVHADISDEGQSVHYPRIRTNAVDGTTGGKTGPSAQKTTIVDKVSYQNLIPGKEYTVKGVLMNRENGKEVLGKDNKSITASVTFRPEKEAGSVELVYQIEKGLLAGATVVVFEDLYHNDIKVASHADIKDQNQTVSYPDVTTDAKDGSTKDHAGTVTAKASVTDVVTYHKLSAGKKYTVKGVLMDKTSGTPLLDAEGKQITSETEFTAEKADGTVELAFTLDSSLLEGRTVVVFENMYQDGKEVAVHADINDEGQSVHYPRIRTNAVDGKTGEKTGNSSEETTIIDTVTYENLIPGLEYTVSGKLMNKADGKAVLDKGGKEITASVYFRPEKTEGSVRLTYKVEAGILQGGTVVVFEDLYHNGIMVTSHADINDADQTVDYPEIRTNAVDGTTGDHLGTSAQKTTIVDTVTYKNLTPGREYTVTGKLVNQKDGRDVLDKNQKSITASITFKPEKTAGSVKLVYQIEKGMLEGSSVVVFEDLYYNNDKVASHADIKDQNQTVSYPKVTTDASDGLTGEHAGTAAEKATVNDTVTYHNLVIGKKYSVKGVLMNKETGEPVRDAKGQQIISEKEFTADKKDGTVDLAFTLDSRLLEGSTVVVFEDLYHNNVKIAVHADIEDEDQSIHYPAVRTSAVDGKTKDHVGISTEETMIIDTVTYRNLIPGKEYTLTGKLMNKDDRKPVLGRDGKEITASAAFRPEKEEGTIDLTYKVEAGLLEGRSVVVFEDLYLDKVRVAGHADLSDEEQSVYYPGVTTDAADGLTRDHTGTVSEKATVTDVVTYHNLIIGKEYKVSGTLMNQETNSPVLDADGKAVRAEVSFTAEKKDGTIELVFELDAGLLAGTTVVAFEDLYHNDVKVAAHADIEDEEQSVHYPEVWTEASDGQTQDHVGTEQKKAVIHDEVRCENLTAGKEYTVKGTLMDKDTGKEILTSEGSPVTAESTFTAEDTSGSISLDFVIDSELLEGRTVVVFEDLYHNDVKVAFHADLNDEDQSIHYPRVSTSAADELTKDHTGAYAEEVRIRDAVYYDNLVAGKEYTVKGILMNRDTGKEILTADGEQITAEETFTPGSSEGSIILTFTLDSSLLEGTTVVVFEDLYHNDVRVASHADIEDEEQSIHYPRIRTNAADGLTGEHSGPVSKETTVIDHVSYTNLIAGKEYTVKGILMNKETGKELLTSEGDPVEASETFTAQAPEGSVKLTFTLDSSLLAGTTVVAYEDLYHNNVKVAVHADIEDEDQSVHYPKISTKASFGNNEKTRTASGLVTVVDAVSYTNLVPGLTYTVKGRLMDKKTGKVLTVNGKEVTATADFEAKEADGTVNISFKFKADGLGGSELVAYQYVYLKDILIGSHEDIKDRDQAVSLTVPSTPPKERPKTGDAADFLLYLFLALVAGGCLCTYGAFYCLKREEEAQERRRRS